MIGSVLELVGPVLVYFYRVAYAKLICSFCLSVTAQIRP